MKVPKKVWVNALVVGIVLLVAGTFAYRYYSQLVAKHEEAQKAVSTAKTLNIGSDTDGRFTYYVNLAGAYNNAGEYQKALENLQSADKLITDRSVNGSSVNISTAEIYTKLGDKESARKYYERELARIKGTQNDEAEKYIRDLEAKL